MEMAAQGPNAATDGSRNTKHVDDYENLVTLDDTMIVYRFGVKSIVGESLDVVMKQMRHGHDYANDHVAIERGRRAALLAVDDTREVAEAVEAVKAATKATRKAAVNALRAARKAAREAAADELARIQALDEVIRRDARALTPAYWGTYLTVEASAQQQRAMPLYESDAITPATPQFRRWLEEGQVGVQIQKGLTTAEVRRGGDTRVRLVRSDRKVQGTAASRVNEYADLWIRVDSEGRDPVWAIARIVMHRQIPDAARWKYVRISRRREGRTFAWSVEITVDVERPARTLDTALEGAVAVEPCWVRSQLGAEFVCAFVVDDRGERWSLTVPARVVGALDKADSIRSIRDQLANTMRAEVKRLLTETGEALPPWLIEARDSIHLWKSPEPAYRLASRWREERCEAAREAYEILLAWELRDDHLWRYEAGSRGQAIRSRNDHYRCLAAALSRTYRHVLVPKRDYSREARFGPDADLRFITSPSSLVMALEGAFDGGTSAYDVPWDKESKAAWRDTACERFATGDATIVARRVKKNDGGEKGGAWAARKRKKAEKIVDQRQA